VLTEEGADPKDPKKVASAPARCHPRTLKNDRPALHPALSQRVVETRALPAIFRRGE